MASTLQVSTMPNKPKNPKDYTRQRSRRERLILTGTCVSCGQLPAVTDKRHCAECALKKCQFAHTRVVVIKQQVITHYGEICKCCDESVLEFLTVDHVYGNGKSDRQDIGGGTKFYRWLIKNNFPPGFQVLCFNCNSGRWINKGICPHQEAKANI